MKITLELADKLYSANLSEAHSIGIGLWAHPRPQPNAFYAPPYDSDPVREGDFVGSTQEGGVVNFKNLFINPHGNGTHTECVGHIAKETYVLPASLIQYHFASQLVSITPNIRNNGDHVIEKSQLPKPIKGVEAYIIRSLPNVPDKQTKNWSGTNPPYIDEAATKYLVKHGIQHLLLDMPSVDRESDGGVLASHHAFWKYPKDTRIHATITEMIYVPNHLLDGLYMLNIQVTTLQEDASPSNPVLYKLEEV